MRCLQCSKNSVVAPPGGSAVLLRHHRKRARQVYSARCREIFTTRVADEGRSAKRIVPVFPSPLTSVRIGHLAGRAPP
jgi:hypothetical protein